MFRPRFLDVLLSAFAGAHWLGPLFNSQNRDGKVKTFLPQATAYPDISAPETSQPRAFATYQPQDDTRQIDTHGVPERSASSKDPLAQEGLDEADGKVDLNAASEEALSQLPGMSRFLAMEAVRFREKSQGFASVEAFGQLLGLNPYAMNRLREQVTLRPYREDAAKVTAKHLDLNLATLEDLRGLSFLTADTMTQLLHLREQSGGFQTLEEVFQKLDLPPHHRVLLLDKVMVSGATAAESRTGRMIDY